MKCARKLQEIMLHHMVTNQILRTLLEITRHYLLCSKFFIYSDAQPQFSFRNVVINGAAESSDYRSSSALPPLLNSRQFDQIISISWMHGWMDNLSHFILCVPRAKGWDCIIHVTHPSTSFFGIYSTCALKIPFQRGQA